MSLDKPIVILGAARSGTTLLAELMSGHPDIAYWVEPKYIWRYGDPRAESDVRSAEAATRSVQRYINKSFERFLAKSGKQRFMEKTPSNCFRVGFVEKVLPDARYVCLYRDGRDVTMSAARKWTTPPDKSALKRRLLSMEIPLRDLPYYSTDFIRDVVARQFHASGAYIWGPFFPGIREIRETHSLVQTCAIQWRESVKAMREGIKRIDRSRIFELHYEEFIESPSETLERLLDFCELPVNKELMNHADERVRNYNIRSWRDYHSVDEICAIEPLMTEQLQELGYQRVCDSVSGIENGNPG